MEDHDSWQRYFDYAIQHNEKQICELTLQRKDGTRFDVRVDGQRITATAKPLLRITLSDITERKLLDRVLQENIQDLATARKVAEKANLAKSEFLSSMSHELRSPLNAILGFAQLLESGTPLPTPIQKSRIEQIVQSGWYLLDLINEILDLALIESGKLSLTLETISLQSALLDCQTMIEPLAEKSSISLTFPPFDTPCFVHADRTRLKQVLINLLTNAIKYNSKQGSVEVTFHTRIADRIHISVRDSGAGLSADKIRQLFQPFNRLGQETGSEEGTGIGLVVCKRLVELMGGEIGVDSTTGVGSDFWIELPLALPPPIEAKVSDLPATVPDAAVQPVQSVKTRHSVLYVEDNPANMLLVEQILDRRPELRLLKAGNGTSGIAMARIHLPRVILMDINLPGISGIQAMKILRDDEATKHIPVLAISANAMPQDIENGLQAGFFRYITKPIKVKEFLSALDQALSLAEMRSNNEDAPGEKS
jgi:signal transduction histidine kinase/ActR/RegA family two-component response regulator